MWLLSFPVFVLMEVIYLVRHPWGFSWLAALVGLGIGGLSYLFMYRGESLILVFFTQAVAIVVYYVIKGGQQRG